MARSILSIIFSYLLGSVSFGSLVGRLWAGIDIRRYGSGNPGATNISRILGIGPGMVVLILDGLKGFISVWLTTWWTGMEIAGMLAGLAAIVGHNWPVFFKFRGGKGVATTVGAMFAVSVLSALIAGLVTLGVIFITRYVSLGSLVFVTFLPVFLILFTHNWAVFFISLAILALVYWRHRTNIRRLMSGREPKFGRERQGF